MHALHTSPAYSYFAIYNHGYILANKQQSGDLTQESAKLFFEESRLLATLRYSTRVDDHVRIT